MLMQQLPSALVALLPVLVFLAALLWLDSYKLLAPSARRRGDRRRRRDGGA